MTPSTPAPTDAGALAQTASDLIQSLGNGQGAQWVKAHLDYPHKDWCLSWPFSRNTSGYAQIGAKGLSVHRVMCEYRNGPPPSDEHHAAHSCGLGADGCVNPWHLDWKTPSENQVDRYRHSGPQGPKLTPVQIDEIRALKGRATHADIARQFGVSPSSIQQILAGKVWSKITRKRNFTVEEIKLIRRTPWQEKSAAQFATEFGVHISTIERIRQFKSYLDVEPESLKLAEQALQRQAVSKPDIDGLASDLVAAAEQETRGGEPLYRRVITKDRIWYEPAAPQQSPRLEREGIVSIVEDKLGNWLFEINHSFPKWQIEQAADAILALLSPDTTVASSTSQVSPGFTQCAHCWQPATCKKYGCSEPVSSNHPREVSK